MISSLRRILKLFFSQKESKLTPLSFEQYKIDLLNDPEKAKLAFERAWATRDFEIEMYWKRATYSWAFIASTFVGYFALVNSNYYHQPDKFDHAEVYFLICIGFVLSFAWLLINIGSKTWQRQWEMHIDLLEDQFTGPLYKTVYATKTFSVSKINEIVSLVFVFIWMLLGIKYLLDNNLINLPPCRINWLVAFSTFGAFLAVAAMIFGHGRGRFSERKILMYRRGISYKNPN